MEAKVATSTTSNPSNRKMAKYEKMKEMGVPEHVIRSKMKLNGLSEIEQEAFFNPQSGLKPPNPALAPKYEQMKKMGMPMQSIVNKMRLDGISSDDIAQFENL